MPRYASQPALPESPPAIPPRPQAGGISTGLPTMARQAAKNPSPAANPALPAVAPATVAGVRNLGGGVHFPMKGPDQDDPGMGLPPVAALAKAAAGRPASRARPDAGTSRFPASRPMLPRDADLRADAARRPTVFHAAVAAVGPGKSASDVRFLEALADRCAAAGCAPARAAAGLEKAARDLPPQARELILEYAKQVANDAGKAPPATLSGELMGGLALGGLGGLMMAPHTALGGLALGTMLPGPGRRSEGAGRGFYIGGAAGLGGGLGTGLGSVVGSRLGDLVGHGEAGMALGALGGLGVGALTGGKLMSRLMGPASWHEEEKRGADKTAGILDGLGRYSLKNMGKVLPRLGAVVPAPIKSLWRSGIGGWGGLASMGGHALAGGLTANQAAGEHEGWMPELAGAGLGFLGGARGAGVAGRAVPTMARNAIRVGGTLGGAGWVADRMAGTDTFGTLGSRVGLGLGAASGLPGVGRYAHGVTGAVEDAAGAFADAPMRAARGLGRLIAGPPGGSVARRAGAVAGGLGLVGSGAVAARSAIQSTAAEGARQGAERVLDQTLAQVGMTREQLPQLASQVKQMAAAGHDVSGILGSINGIVDPVLRLIPGLDVGSMHPLTKLMLLIGGGTALGGLLAGNGTALGLGGAGLLGALAAHAYGARGVAPGAPAPPAAPAVATELSDATQAGRAIPYVPPSSLPTFAAPGAGVGSIGVGAAQLAAEGVQ